MIPMSCASQGAILGTMAKRKNPAAVALAKLRARSLTAEERSEIGRMGGTVGGAARAKKLSKGERKEIARKAAQARWGKRKKSKGTDS